MRTAFLEELLAAAEVVPELNLVVGDLGYEVVEAFAKAFPERFLNAGVAEQNMAGIAAGLAMAGRRVFIYSIANFATLRCLEQIRNDICHHRLDVTVVSVGAGFAYGNLGYSHHAVQDIACLRGFPGMTLATPADPWETRAVVRHLVRTGGPAYLRLGKSGETAAHDGVPDLGHGRPILVRAGSSTAIVACGPIITEALAAARQTGAAVFSLALWADDQVTRSALVELVHGHDRVVVVEEHVAAGGVGAFMRETLEPRPELQARLRCVSASPCSLGQVGTQAWLRRAAGIDAASLIRAVTGP